MSESNEQQEDPKMADLLERLNQASELVTCHCKLPGRAMPWEHQPSCPRYMHVKRPPRDLHS